MKAINIHTPVWNGGNPYLSVRTDRINEGVNFVETDYKNKHGDRTFPRIYYLPSSYCTEIYNERWGKAFHAHLNELETCLFHFVIEWNGYGDEPDQEFKETRYNYKDMLESIKDYLNQWEGRGAYLADCWLETSKKSHNVDLTDMVKAMLEGELLREVA